MNLNPPESWSNLEKDCMLVHSCSGFQLNYAVSRRDRKAQRRIEKEQGDVKDVIEAVKDSLYANPNQTPEELTKSVIAILAPWFLKFLGSWLLSQFQAKILNWIINQLKTSV